MTAFERKKVARARKGDFDDRIITSKENTDAEILSLINIAKILEHNDTVFHHVYAKDGKFFVIFNPLRRSLKDLKSEQYILYRNVFYSLSEKDFDIILVVIDKDGKEKEFTYEELVELSGGKKHEIYRS